MKKQVQEAFEGLKMPDACAAKIEKSLNSPPRTPGVRYTAEPTPVHTRRGWLTAMAAVACLILGLAVLGNPAQEPTPQLTDAPMTEVQETTEAPETTEETQPVYDKETQRAIKRLESGFSYTEGNVSYTYSDSGASLDIRYDNSGDSASSPFTQTVDGRVYFIANGEYLDITDQFSEEEPFTYIFTDRMLLTHYIAIGGTPDHIGYLEMLHKSWDPSMRGGLGGYGRGSWNNEAEERYGWEQRAKEIFKPYGVYWAS